MRKYIRTPNLPEGRVAEIICGADDIMILDFFESNGITVLKNKPNKFIDKATSAHADMAALHLGDNKIIIDKSQIELKNELSNRDFCVYETADAIKGEYPCEIRLNFAFSNNYVFGNFKYADPLIHEIVEPEKRINVRQGYCKCSTLLINENALITDDPGIYCKSTENGFDALLVSKGDISLPGHDYGFIGGASGKIDRHTIVFFGDITKHRDYSSIKNFITQHDCSYVCTDSSELRDIGGILPLTEM